MDFKLKLHHKIFVPFIFCALVCGSNVFAQNKELKRDDVIENELQAAIERAHLDGTEQSQENFKRIQQQTIEEIDELGGKNEFQQTPEFSKSGGIATNEKKKKVFVKDPSAEQTQENLHKIQKQTAQEIEDLRWKDEFGQKSEYAETQHSTPTESTQKDFLENQDEIDRNFPPVKFADNPMEINSQPTKESKHQFELSTEVYRYKYTENIGVKIAGVKGGLTGAYQYRLFDNPEIHTIKDFFSRSSKPNILRLEARTSYGKVDYEGSGTWGGIPDLNFETRGLFGMEIPVEENLMFVPFGGLGYRYLYNDMSKYPASIVDGQQYFSGYDRESSYIYIPLGLEAKTKFAQKWSLAVKGEFDWFIWGKQISHLEDSVDENDVKSGYDKLSNTQKHGLGWRMSARLMRQTGPFDLFVEPFIRYWHIEDSEVSLITTNGSAICQGNLCSAGLEPDNKTWEYGLNLGAKF
jgi:hypothetical protein